VRLLQERVGHERILPLNRKWSLYEAPPAVLPPNGAMVYGLRDAQGYDSLFTGQYKAFANGLARTDRYGVKDASPREVGNMVFAQDANAPQSPALAAAFAVTPSTLDSKRFSAELAPSGDPIYNRGQEMAIYALPRSEKRAHLVAQGAFAGEFAPPEWLEDGATRLRLRVSASIAANLLLADQFFPGWKARIDGKEVAIQRRADVSIFRSVPLETGTHEVAFSYEPAGFRTGLYLALFACLSLGIAIGWRRR
jgi:hypothetical protein